MRHFTGLTAAVIAAAAFISAPALAQNRDRERDFRAERMVELLDTDGNGTVSIEEIFAEHARLFAAADIDGDGVLSVDEFRRRGRLFQSLGTATLFDMLDANGDRTLSADEINRPSQRWFSRYDTDGDGAMAPDEFSASDDGGRQRRR